MKTQVHIEHIPDSAYPQWDEHSCYGASKAYPEFASHNFTLSQDNQVYEMVRNTLAALNMDREHFGTDRWNPLAELIAKGDTVLIKPNMVRHINGSDNGGLDCLVTHPSIVRAVIDYVALALEGSGRIILADAPVQSCDFDTLVRELHYDRMAEFYSEQGIYIELADLRELECAGVYSDKDADASSGGKSVEVMMDKDSAFHFPGKKHGSSEKYRITNYLPEYMELYHKGDRHTYSIAKAVIGADVIINLPKPKTHRKAGMTASLKNMVGCVARKECLPHHTKGSKDERGDEYLKRSFFKKCRTALEEKNDKLVFAGRKKSGIYSIIEIILYKAARLLQADAYTEGSWYGNDTLWRTICDVCRIIMYADKNGVMSQDRQRKMFILADMIVAGEGEGPLCPQPKYMGILAGGWEQIAVDTVIAALMGFSAERIPAIANAGFGTKYSLSKDVISITSNALAYRDKTVREIRQEAVPFIPTSGWKQWLLEETV